MLTIIIPSRELYNEETEEFVETKAYRLQLKHSLVSVSKWEAQWKKPFLIPDPKTQAETIDYIRCMTITQNIPSEAYTFLTRDNIQDINEYIDDAMSATIVNDPETGAGSREVITSELIYQWMIALTIPFECQKWHLNRLLTLVRVCNIKNSPPKKMGRGELLRRNRDLNNKRREMLNTKG